MQCLITLSFSGGKANFWKQRNVILVSTRSNPNARFSNYGLLGFYSDFSEKYVASIFRVTKFKKWMLQILTAATENIQLQGGEGLRQEQVNARCAV